MNFSLEGKIALVPGGSKSIGRAIALAFAEHGADVAIAARGVQALEATRKEIQATGRRCVAVPTDVSSDRKSTSPGPSTRPVSLLVWRRISP